MRFIDPRTASIFTEMLEMVIDKTSSFKVGPCTAAASYFSKKYRDNPKVSAILSEKCPILRITKNASPNVGLSIKGPRFAPILSVKRPAHFFEEISRNSR
jgi:hypothetical protein